MDNYFNIATEYINLKVGSDHVIVKESINDLNDFYCFTYNSKSYIETGNVSYMTVGQGYNFIHKADKRVFAYGSGTSFNQALNDLEKRLSVEARIKEIKPEFDLETNYWIQIIKVKNKQSLIEKLKNHEATYIIPEQVGGSIFRIPKKYTNKIIEERLKELPVIFKGVSHQNNLFLIDDLIKCDNCEFDIIKHVEKQFAKYVDKANPEDLEPIW